MHTAPFFSTPNFSGFLSGPGVQPRPVFPSPRRIWRALAGVAVWLVVGLCFASSAFAAGNGTEQKLVDPADVFLTEPMREFSDYEEHDWAKKVDIIGYKDSRAARERGSKDADVYELIAYMNLALKEGNAFAAVMLLYPTHRPLLRIIESSGLIADPAFWESYADALTSKGWTQFILVAKARSEGNNNWRRLMVEAAKAGHPAAKYWAARNLIEEPYPGYSLEQVAASVQAGYPYAQAEAGWASWGLHPAEWVSHASLQKNVKVMGLLGVQAAQQGELYGFKVAMRAAEHGWLTGEKDPETAYMYSCLAVKCFRELWRTNQHSLWMLIEPSSGPFMVEPAVNFGLTPEQATAVEARAEEWAVAFRKKRAEAYDTVRKRRAVLSAKAQEQVKEEYLRLYNAFREKRYLLPPNLFEEANTPQE